MKKKRSHKFLIVTAILVLGAGYLYFNNDVKINGILHVAQGSSLVSTTGGDSASDANNSNSKISSDISFLSTLNSLKRITIDSSLFTNVLFSRLEDNSVRIGTITPGRNNPFAPIDESKINNSITASRVVTNQATQIASATATLNGTVNATSGVTDTYFEYGETEALGLVTSTVKQQSLVGNFIKSVSGLNSKTMYYFKACAKISGASFCGDVVPFATK